MCKTFIHLLYIFYSEVNRNNSRNVIVRFINRKNVISALRNRRYLKNSTNAQYKNTFIFENLCSTYRYLFNELTMMKKNDEIYNVWSYNGIVNFKFSEHGAVKKVYHQSDIDYFINNDVFESTARED